MNDAKEHIHKLGNNMTWTVGFLHQLRANENFLTSILPTEFCLLNCFLISLSSLQSAVRSGKSTHITMISNSVTHLRSYTNTTISENSAWSPTSPNRAPISSHWMTSVWQFHDVSHCFKSVSWCFTSGSWCFTSGSWCTTMFYICFMMFYYV